MTTKRADYCEIRVRGLLGDHWRARFDGLTLTPLENGETLIAGPIPDQAALFGILAQVRDLGLYLVSVVCRPERPMDASR